MAASAINNKTLILCLIFLARVSFGEVRIVRDPFSPSSTLSVPTATTLSQKSIWIPLYFSKAATILLFLKAQAGVFLSPSGVLGCDENRNQLYVRDDAKHLAKIREVVRHLDSPGPQFLVKAKIVSVDRDYQKKLGVLFQTKQQGGDKMDAENTASPLNEEGGEFDFSIAKFANQGLLNMRIAALEQQGHATLISSPSLTTLNQVSATIESGAEVPYQEATLSGATSVSFKKAVLRLSVTPESLSNHRILLHITLNQDRVSTLTVKGVPAIETHQITTSVVVKTGETLVLGGILETVRSSQKEGVPVLQAIPFAGELFQHHVRIQKEQSLLIFITPSEIGMIE